MVDWWHAWKHYSQLAWPGDMGEQPQFYIEAIRTCEDEVKAIQNEQHERQIAEIDRQQREAAAKAKR